MFYSFSDGGHWWIHTDHLSGNYEHRSHLPTQVCIQSDCHSIRDSSSSLTTFIAPAYIIYQHAKHYYDSQNGGTSTSLNIWRVSHPVYFGNKF